ncbi:MAG: GNAT family N-acetyltransferase [Acutalibacteraceae bacterium]|nr:GNAT family N-acetyltransferase [Acutalibacteraceae bacterium]
MKIVEFKESDLDTVFQIQQEAYKPLYDKYHDDEFSPYMESKESILYKYTRPDTKGYLFIKDDIAVGSVRIILSPETKTAKVSALGVRPQYQGQGIAQQALLAIEKMHSDVETWFLGTILEEPGNCHLYEKLGYKQTGNTFKVNENMTLVDYIK